MSKIWKLLVASFIFGSAAYADELVCASKADQELYFSEGQLLVRADVNSPTHLSNLEMSFTGSNLGFYEEEDEGRASTKWVRFQAADAWCNYTLTLPKNFMTQVRSVLFVDAICEEGHRYSIQAKCKIQ